MICPSLMELIDPQTGTAHAGHATGGNPSTSKHSPWNMSRSQKEEQCSSFITRHQSNDEKMGGSRTIVIHQTRPNRKQAAVAMLTAWNR